MEMLEKIFKDPEIMKAFRVFREAGSAEETKSRIFRDSLRSLRGDEIARLEKQGNTAEDWSNILVTERFDCNRIFGSRFLGRCVLGHFGGYIDLDQPGKDTSVAVPADSHSSIPTGIYNSTIKDTEIGNEVLVQDTSFLSNYILEEGSAVINCGIISASGTAGYGNDITIAIGNETGGREIQSFAEMSIEIAGFIATNLLDDELQKNYREKVKKYAIRFSPSYGIIERGALLLNVGKISDTLIGPFAIIDGARIIENCTVLSNAEERTTISEGSLVKNSSIQWGCSVESMAIVDTSVLTEHSHVERHGKVTSSIIGPNTGIAEGEVTSSLVGPFVGFHHQSLLIAAIWPEGKGNVGYGANVGSNHTSKAPDQEIYCGEGTFFGLGVDIKFPSNFSESPYSIIATGVSTLPQKVRFPFSLINKAADNIPEISPAYNEIFPGWVLSDNIYTVRRNEGKYRKRNKAKRTSFVFDVFRPEIVELMIDARMRLEKIEEKKRIYLDKDIEGLGKNYLKEKNRLKAIETYSFYIEHYALMGLKEKIDAMLEKGEKLSEETLYGREGGGIYWKHQRSILEREGYLERSLKTNLEKLIALEEEIAIATEKSKEKDDRRGARIIPDYEASHIPAREDSFVVETWERYKKLKGEVQAYGITG